MKPTDVIKPRDEKQTDVRTAVFWYGDKDEGAPWFRLKILGKKGVRRARKKSIPDGKRFKWVGHKKEDNIDEDLLDANLMKETIDEFGDLKMKHLVDIMDLTKVNLSFTGDQAEVEIPCDAEWLDTICEGCDFRFSAWVSECLEDKRAFAEELKEAEVQNLKTAPSPTTSNKPGSDVENVGS